MMGSTRMDSRVPHSNKLITTVYSNSTVINTVQNVTYNTKEGNVS
jgi:hypothetical protein